MRNLISIPVSGKTRLSACHPLVFLVDYIPDGPVVDAAFLRCFRQTYLFGFVASDKGVQFVFVECTVCSAGRISCIFALHDKG